MNKDEDEDIENIAESENKLLLCADNAADIHAAAAKGKNLKMAKLTRDQCRAIMLVMRTGLRHDKKLVMAAMMMLACSWRYTANLFYNIFLPLMDNPTDRLYFLLDLFGFYGRKEIKKFDAEGTVYRSETPESKTIIDLLAQYSPEKATIHTYLSRCKVRDIIDIILSIYEYHTKIDTRQDYDKYKIIRKTVRKLQNDLQQPPTDEQVKAAIYAESGDLISLKLIAKLRGILLHSVSPLSAHTDAEGNQVSIDTVCAKAVWTSSSTPLGYNLEDEVLQEQEDQAIYDIIAAFDPLKRTIISYYVWNGPTNDISSLQEYISLNMPECNLKSDQLGKIARNTLSELEARLTHAGISA